MLCEKTCCAITDILQTMPFFSKNARRKFSNISGKNIPVNAKKDPKVYTFEPYLLVEISGIEPLTS